MRPTLAMIALTTGAALPSSLRAAQEALAAGGPVPDLQDTRTRADKVKWKLPPLLDEELQIVGALAELFATAAAERLVNAGLSLGSGTADDGRASTEGRRKSMRSTLSMIALATGTALCTAALAQARPRLRSRRRRRGEKLKRSSQTP